MLITQRGFTMFKDFDLEGNLRASISKLQQSIESDSTILNQNEESYIILKTKEYEIAPLVLYIDKITASHQEFDIPASYFSSGFMMRDRQSFPKPVFTFHLPFDGDSQLLKTKPSTFMMWTDEISVSGNEIKFEIINFSDEVEKIQKSRDEFLSKLQQQITNINNQVNAYNSELKDIITTSIKKAKAKFNTQADILSKLGNTPPNK